MAYQAARIKYPFRYLIALALPVSLALATPTQAQANERATVIQNGGCQYLLLNSRQGMVIIRHLGGGEAQTGDTLLGNFSAGDFTQLTNSRTDESMSVWVDMVERQSSRVLNQYGRYCS